MSPLWILGFLLIERTMELAVSRKHARVILALGGHEYAPETFPLFVLLHAGFLLSLLLESFPWAAQSGGMHSFLLSLFILLQLHRYWCISSLGPRWNTRIIVLPGVPLCRKGPYRLLRHPNYLGVTLEFLVIPLLLRAPLTLLFFFPLNLLLLKQRIALEESALERDECQ